MKEIAFIVGIAAVCLYFVGYLQKRRNRIILFNVSSRILYIIQYLLLGAFEGAVLDIAGAGSSILAGAKSKPFIKKHTHWFFIGVSIAIIAVGLPLYKNVFSLFPIVAVLLHTGAFWLDDERTIRIVSLIGCPFWLVYNFVSGAYGSCIGDLLSIASITISIVRYDILKMGASGANFSKQNNDINSSEEKI